MHLRKHKKAQGMVEFALLLPVLLLILIGTMEFGRILIIYTSISNATREGSRYGVVAPADKDKIEEIVRDRVILVPPDDLDLIITVGYDSGPRDSRTCNTKDSSFPGGVGGRVIVCTSYKIQAMTFFIQPLLPTGGLNVELMGRRTIQAARASAGAPAPTTTPDGGGLTEAQLTGTAQAGEATATAAALTATAGAPTDTPGAPTDTPDPGATATNTLTPTPIALAPIIIDDPVIEGETIIAGTAAAGQAVTLRIIQTGLVRTVTVDGGGNFSFGGLPGLTAGHTVLVQGYGAQDLEIVQPLPTPTPTNTPTNTPEVTENAISVNVNCANTSSIVLIVNGTGWPSNASDVKDIRFILFRQDGSQVQVDELTFNGGGGFSFPVTISGQLTEGTHHLQAFGVKNGSLVSGYESNQVTISRPCPATRTPTLTPTATPVTEPDLVVSGLVMSEVGPYGTFERLNVTVGISNIGERDVSTLHWVDLYADPTGGDLTSQISVDYVALNAMGAGSTISFTMYVPDGFDTLGVHTIQVMVDTWNQITESDEGNNVSAVLSVDLTIGNLEPEPTSTPAITPGVRGAIEGYTRYDEGGYLSNVAVYVYGVDSRLWGSTRSDIDGAYKVDDLPAGEYLVVGQLRVADAQHVGQAGPVTLISGQTVSGLYVVLSCVSGCPGD